MPSTAVPWKRIVERVDRRALAEDRLLPVELQVLVGEQPVELDVDDGDVLAVAAGMAERVEPADAGPRRQRVALQAGEVGRSRGRARRRLRLRHLDERQGVQPGGELGRTERPRHRHHIVVVEVGERLAALRLARRPLGVELRLAARVQAAEIRQRHPGLRQHRPERLVLDRGEPARAARRDAHLHALGKLHHHLPGGAHRLHVGERRLVRHGARRERRLGSRGQGERQQRGERRRGGDEAAGAHGVSPGSAVSAAGRCPRGGVSSFPVPS
jgi:hypothetical protein